MPLNIEDSDRWENYFNSPAFQADLQNIDDYPPGIFEFKSKIIWPSFVSLTMLNLISLYAIITFPYLEQPYLVMWAIILTYFARLGVSAGVHRLWSHCSYKATKPLRIFLAICYYMSGQQSIYKWVRDHRAHHKYTDTDADPHDCTRGFWYSHMGWLMMEKLPENREYGPKIDMTDVKNDPIVNYFDRNFYIFSPLLAIILPILIPALFFNQSLTWTIISQIFIRYALVLNSTWIVNSLGHLFGYNYYNRYYLTVDNIIVSYLTLGEGWQNFHHVFPTDYRGSEPIGFHNPTATWIDLFAKIGMAYDLQTASPEDIQKMIETKGDGLHPMYTDKNSLNKEYSDMFKM